MLSFHVMLTDMKRIENPGIGRPHSAGRFRLGQEAGSVAGTALDFSIGGAGTPVLFVHGGILTSWFDLVMAEPALADDYQLISYDRPGYGDSSVPVEPLSIAGQATCCIALIRHLSLPKVHLVAHSIGACIALQVALDASDAVASLVLLEPPVFAALTDPSKALAVLRESARLSQQRDTQGALDVFMRGLVDPDYRQVLADRLPDGMAEALRGTDAFFGIDQPSVQRWTFGQTDAARIAQPVMVVMGDRSPLVNPMREQIHRALLQWLPNAESLIVSDATHLLSLQKSREIAMALAGFYRRIGSSAAA